MKFNVEYHGSCEVFEMWVVKVEEMDEYIYLNTLITLERLSLKDYNGNNIWIINENYRLYTSHNYTIEQLVMSFYGQAELEYDEEWKFVD